MKNWCHIDIPGWQSHQPQFQQFVLDRVGNNEQLYHYISAEDFSQHCPDLAQLIESCVGKLERLMIFKMNLAQMQTTLGLKFIHVDSGVKAGRLNWPILNPSSVVTKTYETTSQGYQPHRHYINPPFKDYIDIHDPAHCKEIDQVCIDKPTVFNVLKPHGMFVNGDAWPRVMCSFNFQDSNALAKYLEE